jgi:hypothetical protein
MSFVSFVPKPCCGATFGHKRTCDNWLPPEQELPALRIGNAELYAKNRDLETRLAAAEEVIRHYGDEKNDR